MEEHVARFTDWMKTRGFSPRTIEGYAADVRFFFDFLQNETSSLNIPDVDARTVHSYQTYIFYTETKGRRLAVSSQHARLVAVRTFFRFLLETDVILFDPAASIKLPKKEKKLPEVVLSEKQVELLLDQPDTGTPLGFRDRTMLEVLYASGIRNTELRKLSIYDIDTDQLRLIVRQGKNAKDRIVPLGEIAADYVKEYLLTVRPELNGEPGNTTLFLSKNGKILTKANLVWIIRKYAEKADLPPDVTPHSLRHSCATHMLKRGADIRYIQQMLGHASVATTQIYTQVEDKDLKAVHRRCHPRERGLA